MSSLIQTPSPAAIPLPAVAINIRPGALNDLPFLDALQKLHSNQVGWMPTGQLVEKIRLGQVLVAEEDSTQRHGDTEGRSTCDDLSVTPWLGVENASAKPVGYAIASDQYFKRDDVGIVYQMNVVPGRQRGLIGASLLKAQFERSAYGCKLYCCWCAQDIGANKFWEAMGFVPLAYRAGSETRGKKGGARVHIFWQKRIRQGDTTTPWWFPSKTAGGSIREDRIVLPISPGTHWSEARPLILPTAGVPSASVSSAALPNAVVPAKKKRAAVKKATVVDVRHPFKRNGLWYDIPKQPEPLPEVVAPKETKPKAERTKRVCDPQLVSAARELRDRWLERINSGAFVLEGQGRYDVSRSIEQSPDASTKLLDVGATAADRQAALPMVEVAA